MNASYEVIWRIQGRLGVVSSGNCYDLGNTLIGKNKFENVEKFKNNKSL